MALDEALCYGWVDSLLKKIDERKYMRKFTPRKAYQHLVRNQEKKGGAADQGGPHEEAGMKTIRVAKENGMWDKGVRIPEVDDSPSWGLLLAAFQDKYTWPGTTILH